MLRQLKILINYKVFHQIKLIDKCIPDMNLNMQNMHIYRYSENLLINMETFVLHLTIRFKFVILITL